MKSENVVYGMYSGLARERVGVSVRLKRVTGGVHGPGIVRDAAIVLEIGGWFNEHLEERVATSGGG